MKVVDWDSADDEDGAWRTQGWQRFEAAYAPEDSVYDQLIDDAAANLRHSQTSST